MIHHTHSCTCGGNRSRYTAMCPKQSGFCFPIKQNVTRGLFGKGCGCASSAQQRSSSCGCRNTRQGSCGCGNTRQGSCGCGNKRQNSYESNYYEGYQTARTCACRETQNDSEAYLNPVCPCQRARMEEGYPTSRMEMGGGVVGDCNIREFPSVVPDCDISVKPNGCRLPTPTSMPENPVYAMAYTKMQDFNAIYTPNVAISRGTAFPCLDKPFCGETVGEKGGCGCKGGL